MLAPGILDVLCFQSFYLQNLGVLTLTSKKLPVFFHRDHTDLHEMRDLHVGHGPVRVFHFKFNRAQVQIGPLIKRPRRSAWFPKDIRLESFGPAGVFILLLTAAVAIRRFQNQLLPTDDAPTLLF